MGTAGVAAVWSALAAVAAPAAPWSPPGSSSSAAGAIPEVSLDLERCAALPRGEVVRLVGLELEARVVGPAQASAHAARVVVTCGATPGVELNVAEPLSGKALTRTLGSLAPQVGAAPRIVALAIAELVFTSWLELSEANTAAPHTDATPPPELRRAAQERAQRHAGTPPGSAALAPVAEPQQPPPDPAAVPALVVTSPASAATSRVGDDAGPAQHLYLLAVAEAFGPFEGLGLGWGAGARAGWTPRVPLTGIGPPGARLGAELDLTAASSAADRELGTVRVWSWTVAPRASLKVYPGEARRMWLDVGAGARAGVAWLAGTPADGTIARGSSVVGAWAGATVRVGVGLSVRSVVLAIGLEGGQVLRSVSGAVDDGRPISMAGRWLAASVGVGWGR